VMADQRVIDAYLGSHHDQDLSVEVEEKILAEAHREVESEQDGPDGAATTSMTSTEGEHHV
jgi:hypothetical protein